MPTRDQLKLKLLKEQPHLRVHTPLFNEMFVIRSIYLVGNHAPSMANFTGFSTKFAADTMKKYQTLSLKAYRAHVEGYDYEPTIVESLKQVKQTIQRTFEKRRLQKAFTAFKKKLNFNNRRGLVRG